MRKSVWIFLLAVLVPSAVLGWLALRSAEEQKIILERRTAELYQRETESLAASARAVVDEQRREFTDAVHQILAKEPPDVAAQNFSARIAEVWPRKAVGFAIGDSGQLLCPAPRAAANKPEWQRFIWDNGSFLGGNIAASVYTVPVDALTQTDQMRRNKVAANDYDANSGKFQLSVKGQAQPVSTPAQTQAQEKDKEAFYVMKKMGAPQAAADQKEAKDVLQMQMRFGTPASTPPPSIDTPAPSQAPVQSPATPKEQVREEMAALRAGPEGKVRPAVPPTPLGDRTEAQQPAEVAGDAPQQAAPAPAPQRSVAPKAPAAPMPESTVQRQLNSGQAPANPSLAEEPTKQVDRSTALETRRRGDASQSIRQVQPQQIWEPLDRAVVSNIAPETASFQMLCAGASEGILTRFVQDKLNLVFWLKPPQAPNLVFGCVIDAAELQDLWARIMPAVDPDRSFKREYVLALLDDKAHPVTTSSAGQASRDWKRPFVASEIGEALPHWEAALYLMKPEQLQESAAGLRRTITFLIVAMLGAIAFGGWLVVADARRQLALAQQKTDFVSNVSHELKTPLTSIRMFAELMHGGRAETQAKAPQYLRIIMVEAERLTRLINNVLDFAKLERRQKRFDKKPIDLHCVIERTWESHELHLQEGGFATNWEAAAPPYPVIGDEDALAQILVNLLSNAEKYSADRKEIDLHTYFDDHHVCVSVLDRGIGIPAGEERKIFEAFYRAHDSLSSGIQGSGLGLTLAQRLAHEHDGEITYRSREGGGSAFTLRLPLARKIEAVPA